MTFNGKNSVHSFRASRHQVPGIARNDEKRGVQPVCRRMRS